MSFADEHDDPPDTLATERGLVVVRLSPGQRAALRRVLVGIFEASMDDVTLTAARRVLDALEVQ